MLVFGRRPFLAFLRYRRDCSMAYAVDASHNAAQGRGPRHGLHEAAGRKICAGPGGQRLSCGLRPSGLVECWGNDRKGQATPPDDVQFLQIATSNVVDHACGLTLGARDLKCWGDNRKGQSPEHVDGPWEQVACGSKATCAIADGGSHAVCFGAAAPSVRHAREDRVSRADARQGCPWATATVSRFGRREGWCVSHWAPGRGPLKRTHQVSTCRTGLLRALSLVFSIWLPKARKTHYPPGPSPRRGPRPGDRWTASSYDRFGEPAHA